MITKTSFNNHSVRLWHRTIPAIVLICFAAGIHPALGQDEPLPNAELEAFGSPDEPGVVPKLREIAIELPHDSELVERVRSFADVFRKKHEGVSIEEPGAKKSSPAVFEAELRFPTDTEFEEIERRVHDLRGLGVTRFRFYPARDEHTTIIITNRSRASLKSVNRLRNYGAQEVLSLDVLVRENDEQPTSTAISPPDAGAAATPDVQLLNFIASYCEPCQRMIPLLEKMERDKFIIRRIDITEEPELTRRFAVDRVPTLVLMVEGKEVKRFDGLTDEAELRSEMNKAAQRLSEARHIIDPPATPVENVPGLPAPVTPAAPVEPIPAPVIADAFPATNPLTPSGAESGASIPQATKAEEQLLKIFHLKYAEATDTSVIIQQLFEDRGIILAADARTNSLMIRGNAEVLNEIEAMLLKLDNRPAAGSEPQTDNLPVPDPVQKRLPLNPAINLILVDATTAELRSQYESLENTAQGLADQVRSAVTSLGKNHPDAVKRQADLRTAVQQAFAARQELQRAELAEFARRMQRMHQSIDMRYRIADRIIDRRVEELLDPNLNWELSEDDSAGLPPKAVSDAAPVRSDPVSTEIPAVSTSESPTANPDDWMAAIRSLGEGSGIRRAEAIADLTKALNSSDEKQQLAALKALSQLGDVTMDRGPFRERLLELIALNKAELLVPAFYSLYHCDRQSADLQLLQETLNAPDGNWPRSDHSATHLLLMFADGHIDGLSEEIVLQRLSSSNPAFRREALRGLWGAHVSDKVAARMIELADDAESHHDAIYFGLSTLPEKNSATVDRLIKELSDPDWNNWDRALWGLGYGIAESEQEKVAAAMLDLYQSRNRPGTREKCAEYIRRYGTDEQIRKTENESDDHKSSVDDQVARPTVDQNSGTPEAQAKETE